MSNMFKVGDRILVKSSPYASRVGHYGVVTEFIGHLIRARMDNYQVFRDCLKAGYYTVAKTTAEEDWVLAGPRKSTRGFAKFVRQIESHVPSGTSKIEEVA